MAFAKRLAEVFRDYITDGVPASGVQKPVKSDIRAWGLEVEKRTTKGDDIASASTLNLDSATGYLVDITGNTTITAVTLSEGLECWARFTGTPQITVGASLVGNANGGNIQMAAGDMVLFKGYASSIVRFWVFRLNGKPLTAPSLFDLPTTLGFDQPWNLAISASVAGSALTVAVKGIDGSDPSATNPVAVPFRSATATSGTPTWRSITSALSLTISSGSTMGSANNTAFRIWLVLFDDAGTVRLGAINCLSGTSIYPLGAASISSSTAEGGAGAADSAHVFYTGTAISSKAYRVVGFMEWSAGLATAGTWSAGPTTVQLFGPGIALPGQTVQHVRTTSGAVATGTTALPYDDSVPQSTEGDQYMGQAITPTSAANVLAVEMIGMFAHSSSGVGVGMALFQDSVASALAAVFQTSQAANAAFVMKLQHWMLAGTTSSTTMKMRAGGGTGATVTINGTGGSRLYGGAATSFLDVRELMA